MGIVGRFGSELQMTAPAATQQQLRKGISASTEQCFVRLCLELGLRYTRDAVVTKRLSAVVLGGHGFHTKRLKIRIRVCPWSPQWWVVTFEPNLLLTMKFISILESYFYHSYQIRYIRIYSYIWIGIVGVWTFNYGVRWKFKNVDKDVKHSWWEFDKNNILLQEHIHYILDLKIYILNMYS